MLLVILLLLFECDYLKKSFQAMESDLVPEEATKIFNVQKGNYGLMVLLQLFLKVMKTL